MCKLYMFETSAVVNRKEKAEKPLPWQNEFLPLFLPPVSHSAALWATASGIQHKTLARNVV